MTELSCHCGNIKIETNKKLETLTSCNCSLCNRYGALWGYFTPDEVSIKYEEEPSFYYWGDRYIDFYFCKKCACVTHYKTTQKVEEAKVGVNFRMAKLTDLNDIKIRKLDGADTWKFLN